MAKKKTRKNGEGTLFKRKDGRWQASFIPENGKRVYFYGTSKDEALDKLRTSQREDEKGTMATGPKQRLGDYLIQWLENVHKPTVRISSYVMYKSIINCHLIPGLGRIYVQKLTPQQIQAFYAQKSRENLKPRTISIIHSVLHSALENAVRWNMVSRNVSSLVSVPRLERYQVQPLTLEEAQKLIEVAKGSWLAALLTLAVTTGLRRGELLGLRWSDIDFKKKLLHVRRTVNRYTGYGVVENDPKTKTSLRKVSLPDITVVALLNQRQIIEQARVNAGEGWKERKLVFCGSDGNYINPEKLRRHFIALLEKASLPHIRFHDLRHSAATILFAMGVNPKIIQELLGHSTITMTMDIYSHLFPSMQEDAMNMLNDAFNLEEEKENIDDVKGSEEEDS